jgi:hypothetical protein
MMAPDGWWGRPFGLPRESQFGSRKRLPPPIPPQLEAFPYFFFFGFLVSFFGLLSLATEILPYVEIILACGAEPCVVSKKYAGM